MNNDYYHNPNILECLEMLKQTASEKQVEAIKKADFTRMQNMLTHLAWITPAMAELLKEYRQTTDPLLGNTFFIGSLKSLSCLVANLSSMRESLLQSKALMQHYAEWQKELSNTNEEDEVCEVKKVS